MSRFKCACGARKAAKDEKCRKCAPRKPLPAGVVAGQPVNDSGQYYAADGTFMNADGTRSIFDDVDE